jgi:hypothetical protein
MAGLIIFERGHNHGETLYQPIAWIRRLHVHPYKEQEGIILKQGRTLASLARELERQAQAKKDYLVDTRLVRMETAGGTSRLTIPVNGKGESLPIGDLAARQIADRLKIPFAYYDRMKDALPDLLDQNVNAWFQQNPETRMVRTLDGQARAFLSNRYRRIDNYELAGAVLPTLAETRGVNVVSCEVTERRLYIKVINKRMELEVRPGDIVQSGIVISNSEVGLGALKVESLCFRLICSNGLIAPDYSQRKYHIGRIAASDEEEATVLTKSRFSHRASPLRRHWPNSALVSNPP